MNIAIIGPTYGDKLASIDDMVSQYFHMRETAKALAARQCEVTWVQGYREEGARLIDTVPLKLYRARPFRGGMEDLMSTHVDADSLAGVIAGIKPEFVHIAGILPGDILEIARVCSPYTTRLSASFHGGRPSSNPAYHRLQKLALNKLSVLLFNSRERVQAWRQGGLINTGTAIAVCPETSSFFRLAERAQARRRTGMSGDPVCIATSRLHPLKDPLTLLKGFHRLLGSRPRARLYWVFQTRELLAEVNSMVTAAPELEAAVELRGALEFGDMEDYYNSADFFIQASLEEIGGNSLIEAIACGVIPVVTDIPSFRYLTGGNRFDSLFERGDADGLAGIISAIGSEEYGDYRKNIRAFFDEFLSFDQIAGSLLEAISAST